jgi:hypothetical protein
MPSARISNTTPHTTYKMWVTAKNAIGEGPTSGLVSAQFNGILFATLTDVGNTPQRSVYTDEDGEWVSYLWSGKGGSVTVAEGDEGMIHAVIGGGGGGGSGGWGGLAGGPGGQAEGYVYASAAQHTITCGGGGGRHSTNNGGGGGGSQFITLTAGWGDGAGSSGDCMQGHSRGGNRANQKSTLWGGVERVYNGVGRTNNSGTTGSAAIRVPLANDNVPAGSWVS